MVLKGKMDVFKDLRIPIPQLFESPSLTRVGRFQRGILTSVLVILPILQAIQWQLRKQDYNMEFRCSVRDGVVETNERQELTTQYFAEYRQKYAPVSQGLFLIFVAVNLFIVCLYMSYVWERFNSWFKLKTTKHRGKILSELKASTAVFKAYSLQLCVRLVTAVAYVLYNCLTSSVVLPSEREYRKQWTPPSFVFSENSFDIAVHCYADRAFLSSMFNIALLTSATFSGALSLAELVYTWQETKAFERISDYYFCMFLLRHNSVTETTKMLIEKELFLEEQRETIQALVAKKPVLRLPLVNSRSRSSVPSIPSNIFVSQQKLKYKGVKKQKHKQELFRTYSRTKKLSVSCLEDLFKPGKDAPNPKRILVTGDPGIGKTEFVSKLIQEINSSLFPNESELHSLKFIFSFDFKELDLIDDHISLQEFLYHSAFSLKPADVVHRQIVANPDDVLLVFDGLNEWTVNSLPDHANITQSAKEKMSVVSLVLKLLSGDLLPGCTIVVTSRSSPLLSEIGEIVTFDRYAEIGSFKPEEAKTCVQEFFCDNKSLSITLTNRISSDEDLEIVCRVPQNCLLLCSYVDFVVSRRTSEEFQALQLPSTTTKLFEKLIDTATTLESDQNDHKTFPSDHFDFPKNSQEVLEKLSYLAFQGITQQRYSFTKEDLSLVELSAFEVEILVEAGFLRRLKGSSQKQSNIYSFSSLSIQEYLAATRIVQSTTIGEFRDFLEKANETHCHTLQFVAGLSKDGKKGKGVFVCLMQHLTDAIKLNSFVDEPVIDNQAIAFLCRCLFENGTQLGHPFAREATSTISKTKPIAFTEIGANPQETQAILHCLKEAMGDNVKKVIFESNAMGDGGFRQVASSICDPSSRLEQVNLTNSSVTDDGMLSFLEITARHSFLGIKILGLRGNEISSDGAKYLACVLFSDWCQLEELYLGNNKIGDLGVEYISEALCSGNSKIQTLDLSSNGITHNGVFYMSKALSNPFCSVKTLYLQKNKMLDFGLQDLCESLCTGECNLRVLFASSNEITDDGIRFVEKALAHKSCGLQELYLGYNQVTDKGVKSLLQALPNHQFNLKVLSLASNPITDVGVKMLANALRNSSCNLHRLCISLGRAHVTTTKASKLQVRYVNAF